MRTKFWTQAFAMAVVTLASVAAFAQTAPATQTETPSILSRTHPANGVPATTAGSTTANATTAAPKTQTDLAKVEADRSLARMLNHDATNLSVKYGPGKTEALQTDGGFGIVAMVVRNADGTRSIMCVDNYDTARHLLDTPTPKAVVPSTTAPLQ